MGFVVCLVVGDPQPVPGKSNLRKVVVDVGASEQLSVVTNAPNIRDKTRTAVAMIGTEFELNGQTITVAKTHVGGVLSEGIICDSTMLGWAGGSAGNCVQISADYDLGAKPPSSKPRMGGMGGEVADREQVLSDKEQKALEKAKKKAEQAAKKEARRVKKGDKDKGEKGEGEEVDEDAGADDDKKVAAEEGEEKELKESVDGLTL